MIPKSSVNPGPHKAPAPSATNSLGPHVEPPYTGTEPHGGPNIAPPTAGTSSGGSRTTVAPPTGGSSPAGGGHKTPPNQTPAQSPKVTDKTGTGQ